MLEYYTDCCIIIHQRTWSQVCWPLSVDKSRSVQHPCLLFSSGWPTLCKPHWCCSSYSLKTCNTSSLTTSAHKIPPSKNNSRQKLVQEDLSGQPEYFLFTLDAVVFHQLCAVYQHLWWDIINGLTLEMNHIIVTSLSNIFHRICMWSVADTTKNREPTVIFSDSYSEN